MVLCEEKENKNASNLVNLKLIKKVVLCKEKENKNESNLVNLKLIKKMVLCEEKENKNPPCTKVVMVGVLSSKMTCGAKHQAVTIRRSPTGHGDSSAGIRGMFIKISVSIFQET